MKEKTFYYNFEPLNAWFVFNSVALIILVYGMFNCRCLLCCYPQMWIICGVLLFSWAVWFYKYVIKHKVAVITDKDITIDHCRPLKWADIAGAEERIVRCCGKKKIIVLQPKKDIDYRYNFLQRHNGEFTPFSIPLYGILTPEDEQEITAIVAKKVKLKKLK